MWIRDYPHDFAVRGTAGALSALIKSIISKTYLLHYGSEFLPFLEMLPNNDPDAAWALKIEETPDENEDPYNLSGEDEPPVSGIDSPMSPPVSARERPAPPLLPAPTRERKPSLPLPSILASAMTPTQVETDTSEKQQIKDLVKLAQEVLALDPEEIAQEITRVEVNLFLDIKVCISCPLLSF